jgi:heptaprenyl diphosphate synthase
MMKEKIAYFAGLSAFIGIFENFIPVPIPILRLGLSNIPVCLGFTIFNFKEIFFIVMFKTVFSHLFRGTLFSYPFLIGLSGSIFFMIFTYPFYKLLNKYSSFVSVSVIGSFSHNVGQILVSMIILPISSILYFGFILFSVGTVTGIINGFITNCIHNKFGKRLYG